jgi:hypothetical protein
MTVDEALKASDEIPTLHWAREEVDFGAMPVLAAEVRRLRAEVARVAVFLAILEIGGYLTGELLPTPTPEQP